MTGPQVGDTRPAPPVYEPRFGSVEYFLKATDRAIRVVLGREELARQDAEANQEPWSSPTAQEFAAHVALVRTVMFPFLVEPGQPIRPDEGHTTA